MKIRLNEKYRGPIPRDRLYDAVKASMSYGIVNDGEVWCVSHGCADEVGEFEEEFSRLCTTKEDGTISFPSGEIYLNGNWVRTLGHNLVRKEHIPSLILALLKLMED